MSNWGGARTGAGRPSMGDTDRVPPFDAPVDVVRFLSLRAKTLKISRSELMRQIMQKERYAILSETLEKFLESNDFVEGCKSSTIADHRASGYSVELFLDGEWRVIWDEPTGNKYDSPGVIIRLPKLDMSDYQECINGGMSEEEFFAAAFQNEQEELKQEMRDKLNS